ncbi:double-strand break repair helicase AddA [Altererythrobacter aquiaggeris]|uniref:double-strand break repair helicase AddA n=1 Tax=Aestuarierythrobacter aquiaggeris TaxID=1898396 RepID=UPI0030174909
MAVTVHPLQDNQRDAVDPQESVWLSASAGTGKTQVLSARVLRLLLQPQVAPSQILCLTFTKAGAAEMATRVNEVLAGWVRMEPAALAKDLLAIGADVSPETQARARTLFAGVLDTPGGGLRIDTIHAFAQWLLAAFPEEADLTPGTRAMEDRDRDLLAHDVLAEMLVDAERGGDVSALAAVSDLSMRMGPDGVQSWLMRCADAREVWLGKTGWQGNLRPRVNRLLGLPGDASAEDMAALCSDAKCDVQSLAYCAQALEDWGTKTGLSGAASIRNWLAMDAADRLENLEDFYGTLLNKDGTIKSLAHMEKRDASYGDCAARARAQIEELRGVKSLLDLAQWLTPALDLGRRFALEWEEAKLREGLIDFDDQIRRAAALLTRSDLADWIRYKLDRQFDHILIDEAQDTNESQWSIVFALIEEFLAGEGARDGIMRTLFVVGDYKQAIFRFQGTSPENFDAAKVRVRGAMAAAARNASANRDALSARPLMELGLGRSYRTAQPVLEFVDAAIAAIGDENLGLKDQSDPHIGADRPGLVTLWDPVLDAPGDDDESGEAETWISQPERAMAEKIATQVKIWMDNGFPLVKDKTRNAGPGDVMVLVRKRRDLAGLIVARLHAAGVPVAGVDRLRLGAPLAVRDLLAALRFAVQPDDDLSLANLLVSPLIGWSQDELLRFAHRPKGMRLWRHLRGSRNEHTAGAISRLEALLERADYEPPQALLHWMLVGPWQGRRRLIARLGREAGDPIDELLNAAHTFTATNTASLQGFIRWFDAGDGDLKREAGASDGLVRVMTVHGSKGLQAPIVILADATGNPDASPTRGLTLTEQVPEGQAANVNPRTVPLPPLRREEKHGRIAEAEAEAAKAEREEHWRLLYVAMTRAEEALFIGGALGLRETEPAPDSWYARLASLFSGESTHDKIWGGMREWGSLAPPIPLEPAKTPVGRAALPPWAGTPVGAEPRPPRPLAPSAAGGDKDAYPPLPAGIAEQAARRGSLMHSLLERLPAIIPAERGDAATAWLSRQAPDLSAEDHAEMLAATLKVLSDPDFADIFAPDALAEIPLAATFGGQVIAGTADRLMVTADTVTVVDFKTARRPPADLSQVPASTLKQMSAYAAALGVIYPGRTIAAAVLYTQTPRLIAIPADVLERNKPGLAAPEESYRS